MTLTKQATPLACLVILFSGLAAGAATVAREGGNVFVNNGAGYVKIAAATDVNASSQIMISPGGIASLTYADNCTVQLPEGIWRVQATPPCAAGVVAENADRRLVLLRNHSRGSVHCSIPGRNRPGS